MLLTALLLAAGRARAASVCNFSAASGNWWDSSKWDCGHVPLSVDSVTIPSGDVATDASTAQINVAGMTITGTLSADSQGSAGGGGGYGGAGSVAGGSPYGSLSNPTGLGSGGGAGAARATAGAFRGRLPDEFLGRLTA